METKQPTTERERKMSVQNYKLTRLSTENRAKREAALFRVSSRLNIPAKDLAIGKNRGVIRVILRNGTGLVLAAAKTAEEIN